MKANYTRVNVKFYRTSEYIQDNRSDTEIGAIVFWIVYLLFAMLFIIGPNMLWMTDKCKNGMVDSSIDPYILELETVPYEIKNAKKWNKEASKN